MDQKNKTITEKNDYKAKSWSNPELNPAKVNNLLLKSNEHTIGFESHENSVKLTKVIYTRLFFIKTYTLKSQTFDFEKKIVDEKEKVIYTNGNFPTSSKYHDSLVAFIDKCDRMLKHLTLLSPIYYLSPSVRAKYAEFKRSEQFKNPK